MYTSLDRIDIVTKNKETGREGYVLTDHREPAEISAERELSILYALTRVTAAKVMGAREGGADVTYVCAAAPPDFLREAVASAGASLTVGVQASTPPHPTRAVGELADAAFRGLARRVAEREGVAVDAALLQRLEDATLHSPPQKDEDEPAFWARTLELAAVCGELLRTKTGGQWTESTDMNGLFPFAFTAGNATINVADKAHRGCRRILLVRDVHNRTTADVEVGFLGHCADSLFGADQNRRDDFLRARIDGTSQGMLFARPDDRRADGGNVFGVRNQPLIFIVRLHYSRHGRIGRLRRVAGRLDGGIEGHDWILHFSIRDIFSTERCTATKAAPASSIVASVSASFEPSTNRKSESVNSAVGPQHSGPKHDDLLTDVRTNDRKLVSWARASDE